MTIYYIYLSLLLLTFILIYYGIEWCIRYAPVRIKLLGTALIATLTFRYIGLLILLTIKNIKYLYLLKPLIFLNLLCIPILAFISLYILARNDRIKFSYGFIISGILLAAYILAMIVIPINIVSQGSLGYVIALERSKILFGTYLIINTIVFLYSVLLLEHKSVNKLGIILIILASSITILEIIFREVCGNILPSMVISDVMWILTINFALYRFKK
jgi:hypothetical protein